MYHPSPSPAPAGVGHALVPIGNFVVHFLWFWRQSSILAFEACIKKTFIVCFFLAIFQRLALRRQCYQETLPQSM